MDCWIGLDLGTSFVKAGLYDLMGHELAVAREPLSLNMPAPGWAEQDPREWWLAIQKVLRSLTDRFDARMIRAVCLCAQCPGQVIVGKDQEPLGNAIIWLDQRAADEAAWLDNNVGPQDRLAWIGEAQLGDPHSSPARILWLKNHDPRFERAEYILQPKDFMGFMLTARVATDRNTAYNLAHPVTLAYHPEFLRLLGVREQQLPPVLAATDSLGEVSQSAARTTGLVSGTPVFVGTIDAYCDTLAGGAFIPGQAVDVSGTSEIVSLGVDHKVEGQGVFYTHLAEDAQFICGPMQVGGHLLAWLADSFYPERSEGVPFERMESEASQTAPGADGLVFLPYLQGERAPIWDLQVRGAFLGIKTSHNRKHFSRAVYESVGFAVRHVLEICEDIRGQKVNGVVACGGGARSAFWNKIKADILQKRVLPLETEASACLGATMIAAVGLGFFPNLAKAWAGMSHFGAAVLPDENLADTYNRLYGVYRRAYPGVKTILGTPGVEESK
ncbi:sugar (pentulose and hexulose) kinase [Longilinea arvoryzae]|uniref:Sugar (Pentulose and hexulose) kinase n=1 Tax=Longilinea arvoryzae TaxID=360412 RepID=A0A0S7B903_9CHLR|nr:FGGY family carbohydrate kinase [Longilinea arvoryzae]GAP13983.1 sugar (pentulose and hexulose) kinase [Longilinea arvoryzae]